MSENVLKGKVRQTGRKGPARRLRVAGFVPGIVYGIGENVPVTVKAVDIIKILDVKGGANSILATSFDGDAKERNVMIKSLDVHPVRDTLLHVDLLEIDVTKPIRAAVDLEFTGISVGVKEKGGKLRISLRSLEIESMPRDIPKILEIQLDKLDIGEVWRVKDLQLDPALKVLQNPDTIVASVSEPKDEADDAQADATTAEAQTGQDQEAPSA